MALPVRPSHDSTIPPAVVRAGLIENRRLAEGIHWLTLALPAAWGPPLPGQYVSVTPAPALREDRPGDVRLGLLRRPFSVARFEARPGRCRLGLLYAPVGSVTRALQALEPGAELDLLGPLGTTFPLRGPTPRRLVAGGRGIAPMLFYADYLADRGARIELYYGARRGSELIPLPEALQPLTRWATEDGSRGRRGTVLDLLDGDERAGGSVAACGPHGMLAAVARWARRRRLTCWLSIEEVFGCGLGICSGCAVPAADPPGTYLWACRDGAVVAAERLAWEAWLPGGEPGRSSPEGE